MNPEEVFSGREMIRSFHSRLGSMRERSYCQVFARLLLFSPRIQNNPSSLQQSEKRASDSDGKRRGRGGSLSRAPGESDSLSNWD